MWSLPFSAASNSPCPARSASRTIPSGHRAGTDMKKVHSGACALRVHSIAGNEFYSSQMYMVRGQGDKEVKEGPRMERVSW